MTSQEKEFLLDGMTWSFSRVNAYCTCPRMFQLTYIDEKPKLQNAFAEWGTLGHSLFERYYKGELEFYELADAYRNEYETAVSTPFPFPRMGAGYYANGLSFFENFDNSTYENYEVIGVEEKAKTVIEGFEFIGYIDLILRDKEGRYVIVDHKSKSDFKTADEFNHYLLQLYLYARFVHEKYGEYPARLEFNMFRANKTASEEFDIKKLKSAEQWFVSTIKKAYADNEYSDKVSLDYELKHKDIAEFKKDDFFCNNLCSVRNFCERSKSEEK